ncbi:MAG: hypothetical protein ACREJV_04565 [Candidatus Rokuibacteriota bacterium]
MFNLRALAPGRYDNRERFAALARAKEEHATGGDPAFAEAVAEPPAPDLTDRLRQPPGCALPLDPLGTAEPFGKRLAALELLELRIPGHRAS